MSLIKKSPVKKTDEKKDVIINELIEVLTNIGYRVRIEKGAFKGGFCLLREEKVFLLKKDLEQDRKINILAKNIGDIGVEDMFLKPNIRELIETASGEEV
ncbi:MAG: hypothetical protein JSS63_09090 [Bacteroidetes bacterium]|nr:hypothetical protein [Bacteroidota bacterium]MBX7045790.1 hypothetical protein [Ignavibacteria bacterium]